jgi:hypothetical protein
MEFFSERNGLTPTPHLQIGDLDSELRNALYNIHHVYFIHTLKSYQSVQRGVLSQQQNLEAAFMTAYMSFFNKLITQYSFKEYQEVTAHLFLYEKWYRVFDFMEFLFELNPKGFDMGAFKHGVEDNLVKYKSGYRIVGATFIPITSSVALDSLTELSKKTAKYALNGVAAHLEKAKKHLATRPVPDLSNSIKESISMVGVIARMMTKQSTLGAALKIFSKKKTINPLLNNAFINFYTYTNGADGIRHELMDDSSLDLETAEFFLITCSAFTTYLIQKAIDLGTLTDNEQLPEVE